MRTAAAAALRRLPLLIAAALLAALVANVRAFGSVDYWLPLSSDHFAIAALALALVPIVLTGGIDLSVGSTAVLASIVAGVLWRDAGLPFALALVGGVAAGALCGVGNGLLASLGVLPLVATLATRELYRGLGRAMIDERGVTGLPAWLAAWWDSAPLGLPVGLWLLLLLGLATYAVVHHGWVGRALYAIGDNAEAARFAAVPVRGVRLGLYAWSGFVAGLAGVAMLAKYGAAKADAGQSLELSAVACVVLGGLRVTGGAGGVGGAAVGIVTVLALRGGIDILDARWRDIVFGGVLLAVALAGEAGSRAAAALQGDKR